MTPFHWFLVIMLADLFAKVVCEVASAINTKFTLSKRVAKMFKKKRRRRIKLAKVIPIKKTGTD